MGTGSLSPTTPRASGGAPASARTPRLAYVRALRQRGCCGLRLPRPAVERLRPAQAGVVRSRMAPLPNLSPTPRASRGGPAQSTIERALEACAPRKRGCSELGERPERAEGVGAAQAGVFQPRTTWQSQRRPQPRASRGAPFSYIRCALIRPSALRQQGCSGRAGQCDAETFPRPAQAGVFRPLSPSTPSRRPLRPAPAGVLQTPSPRPSPGHATPRASRGAPPRAVVHDNTRISALPKRGCIGLRQQRTDHALLGPVPSYAPC